MLPAGIEQAKKLTLAPLLVIALLVAYAPAPWSELVWDDQLLVQQQLPRFQSLREVFFPPADISGWTYTYYRPLVTLSYLLDHALFGSNFAIGAHLTNLLLHLLATLGVWRLGQRVFRASPHEATAALSAALLFTLHPIHTESVNWIAGRSDVLATALLLPALLLALRWRDGGSIAAAALSTVGLAGALLAKEAALTGLALLPMLWLLVPSGSRAPARYRGALILVAWLVTAAGYFWMRATAVGPLQTTVDLHAFDALRDATPAAAWYMGKLLYPWPQSAVVSVAMLPGFGVSAIALALALTATGYAAWGWLRRGSGTLLVVAGWFWITISLPLWVIAINATTTPIAERYLYLPSVSLALGAGLLVGALLRTGWRRGTATIGVLVAAALLVTTLHRGQVWRDSRALWADTVSHAPEQGMAWLNLGLSYKRLGQDDAALDAFQHAVAIKGYDSRGRSRALAGAGQILAQRGELDDAAENFRTAIALQPGNAEAWYGLGTVSETRAAQLNTAATPAGADHMEQAIHYYRTATQRQPGYYPARLKLAAVLNAQARRVAAQGRDREAAALRLQAREAWDGLLKRFSPGIADAAVEQLATEVGVDLQQLRRDLM
jgi:Tfp pilus assembly protein PilF